MWEMKGWECKKELKAKQSKFKRCGRLSDIVSAWCVVWLRKKALYQGPLLWSVWGSLHKGTRVLPWRVRAKINLFSVPKAMCPVVPQGESAQRGHLFLSYTKMVHGLVIALIIIVKQEISGDRHERKGCHQGVRQLSFPEKN